MDDDDEKKPLTFIPRLVKNVPHALQSRIQTLCALGAGSVVIACARTNCDDVSALSDG